MTLNKRIGAFARLGEFLIKYTTVDPSFDAFEKTQASQFDQAISSALIHNPWFSKSDIIFNLKHWGRLLQAQPLKSWVKSYDLNGNKPKTVAVIMAGNVPLVGFHDFLSVLISGHKILIKQSSKDFQLLPAIVNFLTAQNSEFKELIRFADEKISGFDAVIATGSNNTARYFEYYFSTKPHIIRKNRNSLALLTGEETREELNRLGEDIFRYYGLGCRNVSKLFIPKGYDFSNFFEGIYAWHPVINFHKYANNYDYNKAVYLMSDFKIRDNGFLILKEDENIASPIAVLFYSYYKNEEELKNILDKNHEKIQCMVSANQYLGGLAFGTTQHPHLTDYADGIDTLHFLGSL